MDCTTAMDSSSTTSERSSHASSPSNGPTPLMVKQQPLSPSSNNNNNNTTSSINHNPGSGSPHTLPPPPSHHHSRHSPLSGPHPGVPAHHLGGGMPHPLSPPPVGPRLAQSLQAHLPPPGLGLLGSLGVSGMLGHHGPLDLMAAHHGPPRSYNSPPPISSSDPTANECKLVEYRGQKVAAFIIAGDTMLCLPQAFELFLKHLVGGLHTVYTKLKRLDIVPLVCNVEQVRILRGLGAIQPGVNRCKLLSCKDFDILYRDCTTARCFTMKATEWPGRPPKRAPVGLSLAASHLHHQQMKKHRLDNGDYPPPYENGHMDMSRMEKSPLLANGYNHPPHLSHMQFMQLPHPAAAHSALLSPGMPHGLGRPDGSVIKNQGMPPAMEAIARSGIWENCRAAYEDIVKHLERLREERGDVDRALALDQKVRDLSSHHGSPNGHSPVLNLSKSGGNGGGSLGSNDGDNDPDHSGSEADGPETALPVGEPHSPRSNSEHEEDEQLSDPEEEDEKDQDLDDGADLPIPAIPNSDSQQALNYSTLASAVAASAGRDGGRGDRDNGSGTPGPQDPSLSSTETLLRNIQGLLKVAADNARQQERQINYEKAELKMDVLREREVKDSLERQLGEEQKLRASK
ncbi:dachshund homolog 1-like [Chrysoperla carnea]|uniref:dachshund homolog 1-like n=1 Tax=Chrysoperla carnea TaxID=189513 RepID=UPI001D060370|nr:dachshund homolog 1-like [Chrysoperla carnea]